MEIKQRIENAKAQHKKAEQVKIQTETQLAAAKEQQEKLIEQMKAEGVTPETIQQEIARLEVGIEADLTKVEQMLPRV